MEKTSLWLSHIFTIYYHSLTAICRRLGALSAITSHAFFNEYYLTDTGGGSWSCVFFMLSILEFVRTS